MGFELRRRTGSLWLHTVSRSLLALALCWSGTASADAQQNTPIVAANLEELSNPPQRRPLAPSSQTVVTAAPEGFDEVQLSPGTLLSMDVYGIPELSGTMLRVNAEGDVSVPMLGTTHLGGLSLGQAEKALSGDFIAQEILVAPILKLNIVQFAAEYVSILGEVQSPGRYQLLAPRSLADVLALAGGETIAAGDDIEVQRAFHTTMHASAPTAQHVHYTQRDASSILQSTLVNPGDSIFVRRAGVVYVLGAVNKPGGYLMVNNGGLNIYQALSLAGGATLDAAKGGMYIIRPHGDSFEQIKVPFAKLLREQQSELQLQLNDVLYLPRSGWRVTLLDGSAIIGAAISGAIYSSR